MIYNNMLWFLLYVRQVAPIGRGLKPNGPRNSRGMIRHKVRQVAPIGRGLKPVACGQCGAALVGQTGRPDW